MVGRFLEWASQRKLALITFAFVGIGVVGALLIGLAWWAGRTIPPPVTTATPVAVTSVQLSPEEGGPGTLVTVTGAGWQPGDTVFVRLDVPADEQEEPEPIASATVGEDGRFVASFTIPSETPWTDVPQALVTVRSPETGDEVVAVLRMLAPDQTSTPTPTATPTSTPAPTAPPPTSTPTAVVVPTATPTPAIARWRGEYYGNRHLTGAPLLVRDDAAVNFNWGFLAPATGLRADRFSARWTRTLSFPGGTYRFYARCDDGVRVWLNGRLIIDEWHDATTATYSAERTLSTGEHALRVEYYEDLGAARIQFWWERVGDFPQWRGEYFPNVDLVGASTLVRNDVTIDFNWGYNAPAVGLPPDGFSVRWTRVRAFNGGLYRFQAVMDDGVRLYVDDALVIDAWRDGPRREVTADLRLSAGSHSLRVEYYERTGAALIEMSWTRLEAYPDWRGEYWSNRGLQGSPRLVRNDESLDFNWRQGAPAGGLPADNFSGRWTRTAQFDAATYRFHVLVDDGARLWVDDQLIIDTWRDGAARELTADYPLVQGTHSLRVEFYEHTGQARIRVWWEKVASPSYPDWKGEYWSNRGLTGTPALVRNDVVVDFHWGTGAAAVGLPADNFSVRWSRQVTFDPGVYRLYAWADDGIRVFVDGDLVLNEWHDSAGDEVYMVGLLLRDSRQLVVEYYERGGEARAKFWWQRMGDWPTPTPTPSPTPTSVPNQPPVAVDDSASTDRDTPVEVNVLANDSDPEGDPLTVSDYETTSTEGGVVSCTAGGVCTYTPPAGFSGSDTFGYTVSDGRGGVDTGTVTVTVGGENQAPVAVDDLATTRRNTGVDIDVLANDSDPDGDPLTVSDYESSSTEGGTVDCGNGVTCTYVPPVNFIGSDTFTYTASDGRGGSDIATVAVFVDPSNAPPVATDDFATIDGDTSVDINVLHNDNDPDGDPLVVSDYDTSSAEGGAVSCTAGGVCTYTPPAGFSGSDSFTYAISDGNGGTDTATVTVTSVYLSEVLAAPSAVDWDGDGIADERDEYIELHNAATIALDLGGWALEDGVEDTGTYVIPQGTVLQPGAFVVFYRSDTGIALEDEGDQVRLLGPDGALVDAVTFSALPADASYSRDEAGAWQTDWPPSPGGPNLPPTSAQELG